MRPRRSFPAPPETSTIGKLWQDLFTRAQDGRKHAPDGGNDATTGTGSACLPNRE